MVRTCRGGKYSQSVCWWQIALRGKRRLQLQLAESADMYLCNTWSSSGMAFLYSGLLSVNRGDLPCPGLCNICRVVGQTYQ